MDEIPFSYLAAAFLSKVDVSKTPLSEMMQASLQVKLFMVVVRPLVAPVVDICT